MAGFPGALRTIGAALLLFAFAGGPARANTVTDKLHECLDIVAATSNVVQAGLDGATKIADAMADPKNAACISEASAGNPVTIAFMGAMTGLFVAATAEGEQPFHNAEECNKAIKDTLAGLIAGLLQSVLNSDFIGDILRSILPDAAVGLILEVANNVASASSGQLADAMIAALGPVGHYLECGCAAAGIAAIVYDTGKDVADKAGKVGEDAKACANLGEMLWDDPAGFAAALIGDPGAVIEAAVDAVCKSAGDVSEGLCDAASVVFGAARWACDKSGVCEVAAAFWEGVSDTGREIACIFTDCSEPPPPTPPPACEAGFVDRSTLTGGAACTCQQPNGWVWSTEYRYSALYGSQEKYDVKTCRACAANEGNQGGWCVKCPPGFNQDPATGQCSKPVVCPAGSIIKPDNSGCYACPAGSVFAADGSGCTPDCSAQPWTKLEKGYSAAPAGYYAAGFGAVPPWSGGVCACPKGQYNNGKGCVTKLECPAYQRADEKTGTCINYCTGANMHYVDTSPPSCVPCGAGMTSVDNSCVPICAEGAIRTGDSCQACPTGTQAGDTANTAGESTTCSPVCRPGSTYAPPPATDGTPTTLASGGLNLNNSGASAATGPALQGNASMNGATTSAAHNTQGVSGALGAVANAGTAQGGAGANNAGGTRNDYCQPCAANQRYITTVSMTSGGGSITQGACQTCPTGMVASRDHKSCVYTFTGVFSATRTASRPVPTTVRTNTSAPEPQRPTPPRERAQAPERPAPRQALRCPPGRAPNASGTACIVDLDDSGAAPGRANTPSGGGGATYRR